MPRIGFGELLIIFAVAALLFGFKRLPELGKTLGQAINNFKRSVNEPEERDGSQDGKDGKA